MYQEKLAVAIKHNGKILRETGDLVQLPFGSEFSVLVKNLNSRRVKFTLQIDGTDVLDGEEIVVNANSDVEMKRFIRNGNMNEGNAFKFIERTAAIEDGPRGVKVDDGIVRVEFWFEQEQPEVKTTIHDDVWWDPYWRHPYYKRYDSSLSGGSARGIGGQSITSSSIVSSVKGMVKSANATSEAGAGATFTSAAAAKPAEVGITVPGSKVEQKFHAVYGFKSEVNSHVIILRLAGRNGEEAIAEPVTVKSKPKCSTCGRTNKATSQYCSACGTALTLL